MLAAQKLPRAVPYCSSKYNTAAMERERASHHPEEHHVEGTNPNQPDDDSDADHHWQATLGVELYLGLIYGVTGKPAEQVHLLDCGAGPGTYAKYMLQRGLGKATLLDYDEEVLGKARKNLKNYGDKVKTVHASLPDLPFEDSSFDAITFNNCLQHICNPKALDFTAISKAFRESYRVLRPGGIVLINDGTAIQSLVHWVDKFPGFVSDFLPLCIPINTYSSLLKENGFRNFKRISCPDGDAFSEDMYTGEETEQTVVSKPPPYTEMVEMVSCPEERRKLRKFKDCMEEMKGFVGHYTIYWAQK